MSAASLDTEAGRHYAAYVGAASERDRLAIAVQNVRDVHQPIDAVHIHGRTETLRQVCTGCGTDDGNWQVWPCPTIRAVNRATVAASVQGGA